MIIFTFTELCSPLLGRVKHGLDDYIYYLRLTGDNIKGGDKGEFAVKVLPHRHPVLYKSGMKQRLTFSHWVQRPEEGYKATKHAY